MGEAAFFSVELIGELAVLVIELDGLSREVPIDLEQARRGAREGPDCGIGACEVELVDHDAKFFGKAEEAGLRCRGGGVRLPLWAAASSSGHSRSTSAYIQPRELTIPT